MTDTTDLAIRSAMPAALAPILDTGLFERAKEVARHMAASGIVGHLGGTPEAAMQVALLSLHWRLPAALVSRHCYKAPNGAVGFETKLLAAILANSGRLTRPPVYFERGEWNRIRGKFRMTTSAKGHEIPTPAWRFPDDEQGLSIVVRCQLRDYDEPVEHEQLLVECWPRMSLLWATRPALMARNQALRGFIAMSMPDLLFSQPFADPLELRDITPSAFFDPPKLAAKVLGEPKEEDAFALGQEAARAGKPMVPPPHWSGRDKESVALRKAYRRGHEADLRNGELADSAESARPAMDDGDIEDIDRERQAALDLDPR